VLPLAWVGWRWLGSNATGSRVPSLVIWFGRIHDFLTLWKDADPDIPIYKQAKAEYARLLAESPKVAARQ